MTAPPSKVPKALAAALAALTLTVTGVSLQNAEPTPEALRDQYTQAVAADPSTSMAVKIAMVMGSIYESSGRHIGTPYVDKLGKGKPLTVCNGITGEGVIAGKTYTPSDCYLLERKRYQRSEGEAKSLLTYWSRYDDFARATFIDFIHNKGAQSLQGSSMRAKANRGDLAGACLENPRWNLGTVNGVRQVLPGLQIRGDSNSEICREWRMGGQ